MELDNPAADPQRSDLSDFSDLENNQGDKKIKKEKGILGAKKKEKKKETRYATLGDESSGEEDGKKKAKKKGFQFGSAKKEKKEKKEREPKLEKEMRKKEKKDKEKEKEKEKDKSKQKLKKIKTDGEIEGKVKVEEVPPVFGVPLSLAVERSRCHDGIKIPVVVRECIDFIEENGLKGEGIYRSSGVKSKVNKLKVAYNTRQSVSLAGSDPAVVASLLKLFLRELPEPVLTQQLISRFEDLSSSKDVSRMLSGLKSLVSELPQCNRNLLEWILVHMVHVIRHEKQNKMSLQNVSIVLSPTMQISHRVLYVLFKHSDQLFGHVVLKKYVPPISGTGGVSVLPESPGEIEEEMKKQESLLEDLHKEISLGVASKATEEQLWEQQRIVTQLKRKLRVAKASQKNAGAKQDHEEELNFSLQTPMSATPAANQEPKEDLPKDSGPGLKEMSSPEEKVDTVGHRVTVQIHQAAESLDPEKGHVTVINLAKVTPPINSSDPNPSESTASMLDEVDSSRSSANEPVDKIVDDKTPSVFKIEQTPPTSFKEQTPSELSKEQTPLVFNKDQTPPVFKAASAPKPLKSEEIMTPAIKIDIQRSLSADKTVQYENVEVKVKKVDFQPDNSLESQPRKEVGIAAEVNGDKKDGTLVKPGGIPLLPPPPSSSKPSSRGLLKPTLVPTQDARMKSKSLPRGLPSDAAAFNISVETKRQHSEPDQMTKNAEAAKELLLLEELRLRFQYEELLNLKSELERRKRTERREVNELQEEIATMQTLYQYRTYSIDSSEDSDEEQEEQQVQTDKLLLVRQMAREEAALEQKKVFLLQKLETERSACLQLRVQIRLEQERLKKKGL